MIPKNLNLVTINWLLIPTAKFFRFSRNRVIAETVGKHLTQNIMKNIFILVLLIMSGILFTSSTKLTKVNSHSDHLNFTISTDTIEAKIIQVINNEGKSIIVLNKGSKHGVKEQNVGIVPKVENSEFTITDVYTFRSKAIMDKVYNSYEKNAHIYIKTPK